jgi:hypothetical protein
MRDNRQAARSALLVATATLALGLARCVPGSYSLLDSGGPILDVSMDAGSMDGSSMDGRSFDGGSTDGNSSDGGPIDGGSLDGASFDVIHDSVSADASDARPPDVDPLAALDQNWDASTLEDGWTVRRSDAATYSPGGGELRVTPTEPCRWSDGTPCSALYTLIRGDFAVSTHVAIRSAAMPTQLPMLGTQDALVGLIARDPRSDMGSEYSLTSGFGASNNVLELEATLTIAGSPSHVSTPPYPQSGDINLRMCRTGSTIALFYRSDTAGPWVSLWSPDLPQFGPALQVGVAAGARTNAADVIALVGPMSFFTPVSSSDCERP